MSLFRPFSLSLLATAVLSTGARPEDRPPSAPQTAVTQALEAMRLHYDGLSRDDPPILLLDADSLESLDRGEPDWAGLGRQVARGGFTPAPRTLEDAFNRTRRTVFYGDGPQFRHAALPPVALLLSQPGQGRFCMAITAGADHDLWPALAGLTLRQKALFFNRHEFWHCAGNRLGDRGGIDGDFDYRAEVLAEETRADLNAAADMIALDGEAPGVLQALAAFRAGSGIGQRSHFSTPALLALATAIDALGLDAFRSLDHTARHAFCLDIAARHRIPAVVLAEMARQDGLPVEAPAAPPATAEDRAAASRLRALLQHYQDIRPATRDPARIDLTPAEAEAARTWDAPARLATEAARHTGTPRQSLAAARVRLLDQLRADVMAAPGTPVHGARILLLEQAYQAALAGLRPSAAPDALRPGA